MNFLNSIRKKVLACNGVLLVILLLVLLFCVYELNKNQELLEKEERAVHELTEISEVEEKFVEFQLAATEFLLLLQNSSKEKRDKLYSEIYEVISSAENPETKALAEDLKKYHQQVLSTAAYFIDDNKMQGSIALKQSTVVSGKIFSTLKKQYKFHKQEMDNLIEEVHRSNNMVSFSLYALLVMMIVVGFGMSMFLANLISDGIHRLKATIEEIESTGNLTQRADIKSNDEVGVLASAFNRLIESLAAIVRDVTHKSDQLASAAEQLSSVTAQTTVGIQRQSDQIHQVATAMNQMSSTVQEVAANAEHASSSADEGNNEAMNGRNVVAKTIAEIGDLAKDVKHSADVIEKLKGDSENIGTVLDVIKTIAEQTNLLALNAAIEAARAGEQGRGFAVVADEVRTLAQRTQESTTEIEELVATLQNGAQEAVEVMERSREKAENTVSQAEHAGTSLDAITQSVASILDMNTQIASAAEEQSATAEEINRNVNAIQDIAQQTASGAEQTSTSSIELNQLGEQMRGLVAKFKV